MLLDEAPIRATAYRHGITEPEIRHALRNIIRYDDERDEFTMYVGPRDVSGQLLEIGVLHAGGGPLVIHAMRCR
ncbi:MAG: hypothetical protein U0V73_09300 [Acidimicrobiia bacterium]